MSEVIVIGCGNPLRGDDGLGWVAVDRLAGMVKTDRVGFMKCRELTPDLSQTLSTTDFVLFIDVAAEGDDKVVRKKVIAPTYELPPLESHSLEPGGIIAYTQALFGNVPRAVLLTIRGESFGYEEKISEKLGEHLDDLVGQARILIDDWLSSSQNKLE